MIFSDPDGQVQFEKMAAPEPKIAETDRRIDELVYQLFGITDEERKIIEGGL